MNALRDFLRSTVAGSTAIVATVVTIMTIGAGTLLIEHENLVDQRDTLKSASNAASIAMTAEMNRVLASQPNISDDVLTAYLAVIGRRYIELNLMHMDDDRRRRAMESLVLDIALNRNAGTLNVEVTADMGGFVMAAALPLFDELAESGPTEARTGVEQAIPPAEVVLALDVSGSMNHRVGRNQAAQDGHESRMDVVKRAAINIVDVLKPSALHRVAIGVVPWAAAVRLEADTAGEWERRGWVRQATSRHYGLPYRSVGEAPAGIDELVTHSPWPWLGCLDGHRLGAVGTHAALPAVSRMLDLPAINTFAMGFFMAGPEQAYTCLQPRPDVMLSQACFTTLSEGAERTRYIRRAEQSPCNAAYPTMLPLSTDHVRIKATINALRPGGGTTYSGLGVLWAQKMLSPEWKAVIGGDGIHPVDSAIDHGGDVRKAIVLLTDGDDTYCGRNNTNCANSAIGVSRDEACSLAKAQGIEVFVIAAMPDVSSAMAEQLRDCSSEAEDSDGRYAFLNTASVESLEAAFADIAAQLASVRRVY